ncbi:MAG TPA: hypothetical protein VGB18_07340 [Candidatus Thermoplasmatota archaeon]
MKLRCPQCSTVVEAMTDPIRCPNCGFSAPLPPGKTSAPAAPPPSEPTSYAHPSPPPTPSYAPYGQPAPTYGAQPYAPPPLPSAYAGVRPVGKQRTPFLIILFSILTLGIYTLVWEWKISKEMDAFTATNRHKILRTGIVFALIGLVVLVIGGAALYASAASLSEAESATTDPAALGGLMGILLAVIVGAGLLLVAYILMIMGFWRVWTALERDDKMRAQPSPTNSTLLLILFILGIVVPYVGIVLVFVVYFMTQQALNRTWNVYGGAGMPMQPAYSTA